ncbi:hypothetical protein ACEPPN_007032 [Leptodophora sp. 'Broadleaf-Isolate-01']
MGNGFASCPTWTVEEVRDESDGHIIRAQAHIKELGPGRDWLGSHLEWTVVEDPTLDGSSQEEVKMRFDKWPDEIVDESERTGTNTVRWLPRFNFCVVVDEKCLASIQKSKSKIGVKEEVVGETPPVFVVLMRAERRVPAWMGGGELNQRRRLVRLSDGDSVDETEQDLEEEERIMREEEQNERDEIAHTVDTPVEAHEATWMYVELGCLLSLYNILHTDSGWELYYVRPPGVFGRDEV